MNTIKIKLRNPTQTVGNVIRITDEARAVLQDIIDENNVSTRQVVSELIVQGAKYIEFVREDDD